MHGEYEFNESTYDDEFEDSPPDDMHGLLHDAFQMPKTSNMLDENEISLIETSLEEQNDEATKFYSFLKDAEKELYPGCTKFTKLAFVIRLIHIKCLNGWSNKSFTMLLELLKEVLPECDNFPGNFYEAKKILRDLGLDYKKIDTWPQNCMLFTKENATADKCTICGTSRWKNVEFNSKTSSRTCFKEKKIPAKVLRHFPLIPRLQRLFMSSKTASYMKWHAQGRTTNGLMRHPVDSLSWKIFDSLNPTIALEHRNVRLELACDGFNPFSNMSIAHSTWPVVLIPYNLPPWMCMKQSFFMLSLLIFGPTAPGNDIDIYLQPLIDELQELWEHGVTTYDVASKQNFLMHAAILWIISDFPVYANLSGWSTKGQFACPSCNKETCSHRLKHGRKFCYMGHRRFLPSNHKFRCDKRPFIGEEELRLPPTQLLGVDVLEQLEHLEPIILGKS